jgi:hypothetical protein
MAGDGIVLDKAAFVFLLSLVKTRTVIGLEENSLTPAGAAAYQAMLREGATSLERTSWAKPQAGGYSVDDGLSLMVAIVAYPQQVVMTTEESADGRRLFLHYLCEGQIVELTFPNTEHVRLALLSGQSVLLERISHILPVSPVEAAPYHLILPKESFLQFKSLALSGKEEMAVALLSHYHLNGEVAALLLDALAIPQGGGTVAAMRCQEKQIVDGRNLALIRGTRVAWLVTELEPNRLQLETARHGATAAFLSRSLKALST